jgi:hypothetical protein
MNKREMTPNERMRERVRDVLLSIAIGFGLAWWFIGWAAS